VKELGRLNDAQVAAMVYAYGRVAAEAVDRVVALADGVPFLAEELLVAPGLPASRRRRQGPPRAASRAPPSAVGHRRRVRPSFRLARLLPAASGLSPDEVVEALERCVAARLLAVEGDGFRFRHALTAEAMFRSVIPSRREAFASAALAALDAAHEELRGELRDLAARLAERTGQPDRAGRHHLQSGEEALERGALHTAVVALRRAPSLLDPAGARDLVRERLVEALALVGRVDDALAVGRELVGRLPEARAAAVHLRLTAATVTAARWDLAGEHLAAARPLVEATGSPGDGCGASLCPLRYLERGEVAGELGGERRAVVDRGEAAVVHEQPPSDRSPARVDPPGGALDAGAGQAVAPALLGVRVGADPRSARARFVRKATDRGRRCPGLPRS
jgi:hypothetical protein